MKPQYYLCGGGGEVECTHWDDVNGCWLHRENVENCFEFQKLKEEAEIADAVENCSLFQKLKEEAEIADAAEES